MGARVQFVDYKNRKILLEDFSNITDENELIALMKEAVGVVHSQPKGSALVVVDMTNARFGPKVSQESKEASKSNTPYIRASALVGIKGVAEIVVNSISRFTGRELRAFATREEAMEWLIKQ
jgi:hypothetical protein